MPLLAAAATGCGGSFVANQTVHITWPSPLATVTVPFTASWTSTGHGHYRYAVFFDLLPIAPGHTMRDLANTNCKRVPTCYPSPTDLSGLGVYITSADSLAVQTLPVVVSVEGYYHPPLQTMTVVLFSGTGNTTSGHRVGDASWQIEFRGSNSLL
ncbi:MAG: hypothetical protein JO368_05570 [Acidimicrobiales bacterium]|nr:hypothetical protein [Acidimicrobiales bacterium]